MILDSHLANNLTIVFDLALNLAIIHLTRKNREAIESTKKISKKVYVALDAERVRRAMQSPSPSDDMISGQLEINDDF